MTKINLKRGCIEDRNGRLNKIKAEIMNEAFDRPQEDMIRSLIMVHNDIRAIIIDCIERIREGQIDTIKPIEGKGGDPE